MFYGICGYVSLYAKHTNINANTSEIAWETGNMKLNLGFHLKMKFEANYRNQNITSHWLGDVITQMVNIIHLIFSRLTVIEVNNTCRDKVKADKINSYKLSSARELLKNEG